MIKYIGSKRLLLPAILDIVGVLPNVRSVVDLFSGTARVGHALKGRGLRVRANDHNAYASTLARCYVEADAEDVRDEAARLIETLGRLSPRAGWFTETYAERARYLHPKNAARVEAIRDAIAAMQLPPVLESVLLVSLMEAADRVDSTTGVQMAFLKQWATRAHNDLALRMPDVLPRAVHGPCEAYTLDAVEAARRLSGDLAYIDPPYNQHSYLGNYHVWETLVRWDAPDVYGIACKRVDVRSRTSPFNSRRRFREAFASVIERIDARVLIVSFSNEGFITREEMEALLARRGHVEVVAHDFKRYVGAQIGIYNPAGAKVGRAGHLRNTEYVYVVGPHDQIAGLPNRLRAQA